MPLVQGSSREAISENIRREKSAGKKQSQAVAIALNVARKARADGGATDDIPDDPFERAAYRVRRSVPVAEKPPSYAAGLETLGTYAPMFMMPWEGLAAGVAPLTQAFPKTAATLGGVGGMAGATGMIEPAKRALTESEALRNTGEYSPDPVISAALTTLTPQALRTPTGELGIFGGRLAQTADKVALAKAEEMAAKGASREDIWKGTGWFQGTDGKWRFEIPDNKSVLGMQDEIPRLELAQQIFERSGVSRDKFATPRHRDLTDSSLKAADFERAQQAPQSLGDIFSHPDLYKAYPSSETIGTRRENMIGVKGRYNPETDQVSFGNELIEDNPALRQAGNEQNKSTLLHELQHAIQHRENFPRGGSPDDFIYQNTPLFKERKSYETPRDAYLRFAGEVEARNVQKRMNMTPEERRANPPWTTEDVPMEDQIIRGVGNGMAFGGSASPPWYVRNEARGMMHTGPIVSAVPGRTDKHNMNVPSGAHVIPADAVSHLGQNNSLAGLATLNYMFPPRTGPYGTRNLPVKSGSPPHMPRMKSDTGGARDSDGPGSPVPVVTAGAEFVVDPIYVHRWGNGDLNRGHNLMDQWILHLRKEHIKTLQNLPPPAKS